MQHCPKCNCDLPADAFAPSKQGKGNEYCAACQRAYNREYYKANKERLNVINRAYAIEHKEQMDEYKRQYIARNPDLYERRKGYYRQRYQENHEKIRAHQREYQKANPALSGRRTMRYYAKKQQAEGDHTAEQWIALRAWFGDKCLCCGTTTRLEADHVIPLDCRGSDFIANIQPLCRSCNASKATKTIDYRDPVQLAAFLTS